MLHTHSIHGAAVSAQEDGLLPLSQHATFILPNLAYHDYEGVALNEEEKPRLVRDLGDKTYLILRNHGLLTLGDSVAEAFFRLYRFEATCRIQVHAQAGGTSLRHIPRPILDSMVNWNNGTTRGKGPGVLAWPGLLRKLDREDSSYRS